jgi:hypothetical protein
MICYRAVVEWIFAKPGATPGHRGFRSLPDLFGGALYRLALLPPARVPPARISRCRRRPWRRLVPHRGVACRFCCCTLAVVRRRRAGSAAFDRPLLRLARTGCAIVLFRCGRRRAGQWLRAPCAQGTPSGDAAHLQPRLRIDAGGSRPRVCRGVRIALSRLDPGSQAICRSLAGRP